MAGGRQQDATEELKRRIQELEQEIRDTDAFWRSETDKLLNRISEQQSEIAQLKGEPWQSTDDEDASVINRKLKEQLQASEEAIQMFRSTIDEQEETIGTLRGEINNLTRQMEELKEDGDEIERNRNDFRKKYLSALDTIEKLKDELKTQGCTDVYYTPVQQSHARSADECEDLKRDVAIMQQVFDSALEGPVTVYYVLLNKTAEWKATMENVFRQIFGTNTIIRQYDESTPLTAPVFVCKDVHIGFTVPELFDQLSLFSTTAQRIKTEQQRNNVYLLCLVENREYKNTPVYNRYPIAADNTIECIELQIRGYSHPMSLRDEDRSGPTRLREIAGPATRRLDVLNALRTGRFKFVWDYLQQTTLPAAAAPRQENPALQQEILSIKQFFDNARKGIVTVYYVLVQRERMEPRDDWVKTIQQAFKMILGNGVIVSQYDQNSTPPSAPVFVCDTYYRSRYDYAKRFDMESHLALTAIDIQKKRKTGTVFLLGLVYTTKPGPQSRFTPIPMPNSYPSMEYIELQFNSEGRQHPFPLITRGATLGWQRLSEIVGPVTKSPDVPPALTEGTFKFVWDYMQTIMPPT